MVAPFLEVAGRILVIKPIFIVGVLIITFILANFINGSMKKSYEKYILFRDNRSKKGKRVTYINKTKFHMLRRFIVSTIYIMGLLMIMSSIPELKKISYSIFAGAGILAIVIGFATQEVFSNIVSGFFISIFEPFRIDDRVRIGDDDGWVDDITQWHTTIRTLENQRLLIPNSIIAKEKIMNFTIADEKVLNFINFGISYDSDIDLAKKIIGEEVVKSEYFLDNTEQHNYLSKDEPFKIRVVSHGDFSIGLRLYAWSRNNSEGFLLKCDLLEIVKKRFDKEGVEIPFPYMTIVEKKNIPKPRRLRQNPVGLSYRTKK
ncbi:MAG: mechanosensitive ion channel family protein [Nanoarchaeota archaeon]|nr:mechanosensitive ion channel family protein [Nanoarchaeota archaeon]